MKTESPYIAPKSKLSSNEDDKPRKDNFFKKFIYGFCFSFSCFFLLVFIVSPKGSDLYHTVLGAFIVSIMSGITSGFFPSQKKLFYIPIGFILMFILVAIIGKFFR